MLYLGTQKACLVAYITVAFLSCLSVFLAGVIQSKPKAMIFICSSMPLFTISMCVYAYSFLIISTY